jgi:hypothetical protein
MIEHINLYIEEDFHTITLDFSPLTITMRDTLYTSLVLDLNFQFTELFQQEGEIVGEGEGGMVYMVGTGWAFRIEPWTKEL